MSRLENHAMLRDAATDVFNLQALMVIGPRNSRKQWLINIGV